MFIAALSTQSTLAQKPVFTSFYPTIGGPGTTITIYSASTLSQIFYVGIGGKSAGFTVGTNSIRATVPAGSTSGYVTIGTIYGTDSLAGFLFNPNLPHISSFSPTHVTGPGSTVVISGTNFFTNGFSGGIQVSFGGIPAESFTINDAATTITAVVGKGAGGHVSVKTPYGADTSVITFFDTAKEAAIGSFYPPAAPPGTVIAIRGVNLGQAASVTFGGWPARSFTNVDSTLIYATVDTGSSGDVVVRTNSWGSDTAHGFTLLSLPYISSISPDTAGPEMTITIKGYNLLVTSSIDICGRAPLSFQVVDPNTITAVLDTGGVSSNGDVVLYAPDGSSDTVAFVYLASLSLDTATSLAASGAVLDAAKAGGLSVYPNPAEGVVTVNYPVLKSNAQLNLFDLQGKLVKAIALPATTGHVTLDVSGVPTGIYLLQWKGGGKSMPYKLMVN